MIEVATVSTAKLELGCTLVLALKYSDGSFDVVAAVHDAVSGAKFVRVFPREPNDHHLTRANAWLQSGGLSSTVRTEV